MGEIKALSFRRSLRNSTIILYVVALWVAYIVVRRSGYDIPNWADFVFSLLNITLISIVDKQLPSRRWKNLGLLLIILEAMIGLSVRLWRFISASIIQEMMR